MADSNSAGPIFYTGIEISTLEQRFVLFLTNFSLRMRIVVIFLTSGGSSRKGFCTYSYLIVTGSIWLSIRDMGTGQTDDRRTTLLP